MLAFILTVLFIHYTVGKNRIMFKSIILINGFGVPQTQKKKGGDEAMEVSYEVRSVVFLLLNVYEF